MDSYQGSIYDPVTLHKYLYANANPVMYTDPSGYSATTEEEAVVAAGLALVVSGIITYDAMVMRLFQNLRLNLEASQIIDPFPMTPEDWRRNILIFPEHDLDISWLITVPATLIYEHTFQVVYAVKREMEILGFPVMERKGTVITQDRESDKAAEELGFSKTNYRSHGQPVYKKGNRYITPDIDSHSGETWKMADSVDNLRSKNTRMGTYDSQLNRIGD